MEVGDKIILKKYEHDEDQPNRNKYTSKLVTIKEVYRNKVNNDSSTFFTEEDNGQFEWCKNNIKSYVSRRYNTIEGTMKNKEEILRDLDMMFKQISKEDKDRLVGDFFKLSAEIYGSYSEMEAKITKYELLIEEKDNKIWKLEGGQNAEY